MDRLVGRTIEFLPSLEELYKNYAAHVVRNGSCLPLDANWTRTDLEDFATYALPVIRRAAGSGRGVVAGAVEVLAEGGLRNADIAANVGVTTSLVKEHLRRIRSDNSLEKMACNS